MTLCYPHTAGSRKEIEISETIIRKRKRETTELEEMSNPKAASFICCYGHRKLLLTFWLHTTLELSLFFLRIPFKNLKNCYAKFQTTTSCLLFNSKQSKGFDLPQTLTYSLLITSKQMI